MSDLVTRSGRGKHLNCVEGVQRPLPELRMLSLSDYKILEDVACDEVVRTNTRSSAE